MGRAWFTVDDTLGASLTVSTAQRTKARDAILESARAKLEARYVETFGCPADRAPWGQPWRSVFEEAQAADLAYERAATALTKLRTALVEAEDVIRAYLPAEGATTMESLEGMTAPELALFGGFFLEHAPLGEALEHVSWMDDLFRQAPMDVFLALADSVEGMVQGVLAARKNRKEAALVRQRHLAAIYGRGTDRRFLAWDTDPWSGAPLPKRRYLPPIGGAPPRAPGTTEWRRATLAALLDIWQVRDTATGDLRRVTNTDIAVVSLLTGALNEYAAKKLETGAALREETKAINLARKRRALITNFIESERWKPVRDAVFEAAEQIAERAPVDSGATAPASGRSGDGSSSKRRARSPK